MEIRFQTQLSMILSFNRRYFYLNCMLVRVKYTSIPAVQTMSSQAQFWPNHIRPQEFVLSLSAHILSLLFISWIAVSYSTASVLCLVKPLPLPLRNTRPIVLTSRLCMPRPNALSLLQSPMKKDLRAFFMTYCFRAFFICYLVCFYLLQLSERGSQIFVIIAFQ